jgi:Ca2+-binding EF-hand superfamily protein
MEREDKITARELMKAIEAWNTYAADRILIDEVLKKYDTNADGKLSREELLPMLSDLKPEGEEATQEDVDLGMAICDLEVTNFIEVEEIKRGKVTTLLILLEHLTPSCASS